jgi:dipeptidase D
MPVANPKTKEVLKWFEEIAKVPRVSKHEEKIREWVLGWAENHNLKSATDDAGNVVINVPATKGYENSPTIIVQGHLDMVGEKTPDSTHDFSKDPIELIYAGEWLKANKTTLGADNGIAIALAMAMILDKDVEHPPLELLLTVDEETGLTGAKQLKKGFVKGRILLNIDSEDEGVFTVGCAGGRDTEIEIPLRFENAEEGASFYKVKAGGMKGGHSGVDIHKQRANAVKVLFRALDMLISEHDVRLAHVKGGSAHNAIPRDAEALVAFNKDVLKKVKSTLGEAEKILKNEFAGVDPELNLKLEPMESDKRKVITAKAMTKAVEAVLALPHGVAAMSTAIPGLVETSDNLATISVKGNKLRILTSQRSSLVSRLTMLSRQIESAGRLAGGTAVTGTGYPPWEPNWDSPLLEKCKKIYKSKFGKDPVVEVIHAGLECGIIGDKYPGMDMLSYGPTLKNPHSPDETLKITDIEKIWTLTAEILKSFK